MIVKKLIYIFMTLFFLVLIFIAYSVISIRMHYNSECGRMHSIAEDGRKIAYLKNWAELKIHQSEFLKALGKDRGLYLGRNDSDIEKMIDLDFQYLGLSRNDIYVGFNKNYKDWDNFLDPNTINSFEVSRSDFGLIIDINAPGDLGLEWPSDDLSQLKKISDGVYVFCK